MKKYLIIVLIFLFGLVGVITGYYYLFMPIKILNVTYDLKEKDIYATLEISKNVIDPVCIDDTHEIKAIDHQCILKISNEEKTIKVKGLFQEIDYLLTPDVNQVLDFTFKTPTILLVKDERKKLSLEIDKIGNPSEEFTLQSDDESIVFTSDKELVGKSSGSTYVNVSLGGITKRIEVVVTDLLVLPKVIPNKPKLSCGIYTEEQNKLLDQFLEYRIQASGYQTRASVVAALRFLTLEFPYQLNYFYESGRLNNNTGGNYVDGEGRFYHKGLYLNKSKYSELVKTKYGPATWGCPLTNWQDEAGFIPGVRYPNGLDCSGFISWAFLNGGFDVGDTGAGDNSWTDDDLSDLGPHTLITRDVLTNGKLKAGDIIAADGHIAMVGGIHDGIIYVGESTTYYKGVVMHPYTIDELLATDYLTYVIYMDDYYKENGNYTDYWE